MVTLSTGLRRTTSTSTAPSTLSARTRRAGTTHLVSSPSSRLYSERCNSYRIFFKRFHFTFYMNGYYSNFYLSPMYYGKTNGICGNMNGYAGDDSYHRFTKKYTTDVRDYFHSWRYDDKTSQCSTYNYVSPVDKQHGNYRNAYSTCYSVSSPESHGRLA